MATNIPEYEGTGIPTINDHPQFVRQPYNTVSELDLNPVGPEEVENGYVGMKDPLVRLSQNMKLRMRHVGKKENPVAVSDEWVWDPEQGKAVPPVGRDPAQPYAKADEVEYTDYGDIERENVRPYSEDFPGNEVNDSIKVTAATSKANTDADMTEAVPVLAVNNIQTREMKLEGRRGEVIGDPISNENYLDRPGMEVKTSETYLGSKEAEEESEDDDESTPEPEPTPDPEPTPEPEPTYYYTAVDTTTVLVPEEGVEYFISDGADGYTSAGSITEWAEGVTYYTRSTTKKRSYTRKTASK